LVILLLLLFTAAVVAFLMKLWIPLRPPPPSQLEMLNGSTVIVKEIDSLFHKTVEVHLNTEDVNSTEFNHSTSNIDFYGMPRPCDHIYGSNYGPKTWSISLTEENITTHTPEYALKGSTFNYKISGHVNNISTIEFVEVCVYRGFDYSMETPEACKKVLLRQDHGSFEVQEAGYYFFKVLDSSGWEVTDYVLRIDGSVYELHVNTDECLGCSINRTNDHCQFFLPLKTKFCLLAEFYPTRLALAHVSLNVEVKDSQFVIMLAPSLSFLCLAAILVSLAVCIPACCCKFCNTRHTLVTIV
jgi:hypothetical protein